jgi:hypothetical protein
MGDRPGQVSGPICPQCNRRPLAYVGAVYCGAACSAEAEMHLPPRAAECDICLGPGPLGAREFKGDMLYVCSECINQ